MQQETSPTALSIPQTVRAGGFRSRPDRQFLHVTGLRTVVTCQGRLERRLDARQTSPAPENQWEGESLGRRDTAHACCPSNTEP